jgi:hypothetical protein
LTAATRLLRIMARIEQLMAEAESITVGDTDDEILLHASELLDEHRRLPADAERKLIVGVTE